MGYLRIFKKVKERGLLYSFKRAPLYLATNILDINRKLLLKSLRSLNDIRYNILSTEKVFHQKDCLYAFYDLAASPTTFDVLVFLVIAEQERIIKKCSYLHIVIVPGYKTNKGVRKGDLEIYNRLSNINKYDIDYLGWRLRNIIVPCCWLIESTVCVTICVTRNEARAFYYSLSHNIFPNNYSVDLPLENHLWNHLVRRAALPVGLPSLRSTVQANKVINEWALKTSNGKKVVTITLRESPYEDARNSNLGEWNKVATTLKERGFFPVIVRDTESTFTLLAPLFDGIYIFNEVSWNIELRAALYEFSYLNLLVNNGPAELCYLNKNIRYLVFKMITLGPYATTQEHYERIEMIPGRQLPMANAYQKIVWKDDVFDTIIKEFDLMHEEITKNGPF